MSRRPKSCRQLPAAVEGRAGGGNERRQELRAGPPRELPAADAVVGPAGGGQERRNGPLGKSPHELPEADDLPLRYRVVA